MGKEVDDGVGPWRSSKAGGGLGARVTKYPETEGREDLHGGKVAAPAVAPRDLQPFWTTNTERRTHTSTESVLLTNDEHA